MQQEESQDIVAPAPQPIDEGPIAIILFSSFEVSLLPSTRIDREEENRQPEEQEEQQEEEQEEKVEEDIGLLSEMVRLGLPTSFANTRKMGSSKSSSAQRKTSTQHKQPHTTPNNHDESAQNLPQNVGIPSADEVAHPEQKVSLDDSTAAPMSSEQYEQLQQQQQQQWWSWYAWWWNQNQSETPEQSSDSATENAANALSDSNQAEADFSSQWQEFLTYYQQQQQQQQLQPSDPSEINALVSEECGISEEIPTNKPTKRKRKNRKQQTVVDQHISREPVNPTTEGDTTPIVKPDLIKYWKQRYHLWSRFDEGVQMDGDGWFSVTPELIAKHIADRCIDSVVTQNSNEPILIVDAFGGVGGNSIQFALSSPRVRVICIDIDETRLTMAAHNAGVYGVSDRIEFLIGDFFQLAPRLQADIVFLSPPWGGPDYAQQETYHVCELLSPLGGQHIFDVASRISPNIAYLLPRNIDADEVASLARIAPHGLSKPCTELEENFINGRVKTITAYFGALVDKKLARNYIRRLRKKKKKK